MKKLMLSIFFFVAMFSISSVAFAYIYIHDGYEGNAVYVHPHYVVYPYVVPSNTVIVNDPYPAVRAVYPVYVHPDYYYGYSHGYYDHRHYYYRN